MALSDNKEKIRTILNKINNLPEAGGVDLSADTVTADTMLDGVTAHDKNGKPITGNIPNNGSIDETIDGIDVTSFTIPAGYTAGGTVSLDDTIDNEVDDQTILIEQIAAALENKAGGGNAGGGGQCTLRLIFVGDDESSDFRLWEPPGLHYFAYLSNGEMCQGNYVGSHDSILEFSDVDVGAPAYFAVHHGMANYKIKEAINAANFVFIDNEAGGVIFVCTNANETTEVTFMASL